jgi:hypothetical protein
VIIMDCAFPAVDGSDWCNVLSAGDEPVLDKGSGESDQPNLIVSGNDHFTDWLGHLA